jgi:hypothetical protein
MRFVRMMPVLLLSALSACSPPLPIETFDDGSPRFDLIAFFMGHTGSWGVIENRSGAPTGRVITDCLGEAEGPDGLHLVQRLTFEDGSIVHRDWHMRRTGPRHYEATANDMVGTAIGEVSGRVFHWRWVLASDSGSRLAEVTLEQWMYLMDSGSMVNRTTVTKLGIVVASVTENFARLP